ncbi:MAG: hypothetical protein FWC44_02955 [Methanomassiliicoccaceae archaeon]|nr:hypothetical protein [Methanomassiliicoccaceae archaeon]
MEIFEYQQVRYGMALWMLQENAGLSFKEARVFLADERGESVDHLAKELKVTKQAIYNLSSAAKAKIEKIEDLDAVFKGYYPLVVNIYIKGKNYEPLF